MTTMISSSIRRYPRSLGGSRRFILLLLLVLSAYKNLIIGPSSSNFIILCSALSGPSVVSSSTSTTATAAATTSPVLLKLTYFDIEGVAECIRLALLLTSADYVDERIQFPEWPTIKPTTPYGQLPTLQITTTDGDNNNNDNNNRIYAQSKAILRYVGSKYGSTTIYPTDKLLPIEEAIGVIEDFQLALRMVLVKQTIGFPDGFYDTEDGQLVIQTIREKFVAEQLPKYINFLIGLLQRNNNQWLATTDTPSIADCVAVPFLRSLSSGRMDHIPVSCLDTYPEIIDYIKRFCALEPIQGRYTTGIF